MRKKLAVLSSRQSGSKKQSCEKRDEDKSLEGGSHSLVLVLPVYRNNHLLGEIGDLKGKGENKRRKSNFYCGGVGRADCEDCDWKPGIKIPSCKCLLTNN